MNFTDNEGFCKIDNFNFQDLLFLGLLSSIFTLIVSQFLVLFIFLMIALEKYINKLKIHTFVLLFCPDHIYYFQQLITLCPTTFDYEPGDLLHL